VARRRAEAGAVVEKQMRWWRMDQESRRGQMSTGVVGSTAPRNDGEAGTGGGEGDERVQGRHNGAVARRRGMRAQAVVHPLAQRGAAVKTDQGMFGDLGVRDRGTAGEQAAGGADDHQRVVGERLGLELGRFVVEDDAEVGLPSGE
jgi:hypothetical protein